MTTLIHRDIIKDFPEETLHAVAEVASRLKLPVYLVGGIIRDYFLHCSSTDLDLVVPVGGEAFCRELITECSAGAFVSLAGKKGEDTARVVFQDITIDVSGFRSQAKTLYEDLLLRDFTLNCMAVDFLELLQEGKTVLIDPANGLAGLRNRELKLLPRAVVDDPLRMLRGYRFQALLDFTLSPVAVEEIVRHKSSIHDVSWERKLVELNTILSSANGAKEFREMADTGLLLELFPELGACKGVEQPDFHHLDVFDHCLETLHCVEKIICHPERYFTCYLTEIKEYLSDSQTRIRLKWAALFHDLGKPSTLSEHKHEKGRVTFHQHDFIGSQMVVEMAGRVRFSREDIKIITDLIDQHMHPFHLSSHYRKGQLTTRAVVRLAKKADQHLIGLFLLAMSDSLASHGRLKPETMEQEIDGLFGQVFSEYISLIRPIQKSKKLLDGNDLINHFNLKPGPEFREILDELELAVIEKTVQNREEAIKWVSRYIKTEKCI